MYCLDKDQMEGLEVYGVENNKNHARLELMLLPCNFLNTQFGYSEDFIHPECVEDLTEQLEYLGPLNLMTYHTREQFNQEGYGSDSILKQSYLWSSQIDEKVPSWVRSTININELEDESDLLQYGLVDSTTFYEYDKNIPQPSSWNKFPTPEHPLRRYKYASLSVNVGPDKLIINRETYSVLDWLGDLGGLFDALVLICSVIVTPVATFSMKATLLSKLFSFKPTDKNNDHLQDQR